MQKATLFIVLYLFMSGFIHAQVDDAIEGVIVETYYITDNKDSTDITGGRILPGTKTFRVYVDLKEGVKLRSIYGDVNHSLIFESDSIIYNYGNGRGQNFGYLIGTNNFKNDPLQAIDSWLTIGKASTKHLGVLKNLDTDGSILGGTKNNGGSQSVSGGLLVNIDSEMGLPLTTADGLAIRNDISFGIWVSSNWDSTIFGSDLPGKRFDSDKKEIYLDNSIGEKDSLNGNKILIAQITTRGSLSFELNLKVEQMGTNKIEIVKYIAKNKMNSDERESPFLTYPFICGCLDPNYLEYNSKKYACPDPSQCTHPIIIGCPDPAACNYNPQANFQNYFAYKNDSARLKQIISDICCYPGHCNNSDLNTACPQIATSKLVMSMYPNPVEKNLSIDVTLNDNSDAKNISLEVFNSFGELVYEESQNALYSKFQLNIDLNRYPKGIYLVRLSDGNTIITDKFIKK